MKNQPSAQSALITADDRSWFLRHPKCVIRFRPMRTNEFELLNSHGISPPAFKPSWCNANVTLEQVAVIDLTRLLQSDAATPCSDETLRIRVVTPKVRSRDTIARLQEELIEAICAELLLLNGLGKSTQQSGQAGEEQRSAA